MILDIGKNTTTTILPDKQATPNDFTNYNEGDKILVYITSVEKTTKGPRVYVSRIDTKFVKRLFEQNIPEVKDQIIEIMGIAREAGEKTKIGLKSKDINVEAIGSCVGEKGNRIKNIVNLLDGEKIEMFKWDDDPKTLITNALYPAKVHSFANLNINKKQALVVVEDNFYQAAMGYKGINKKLVSAATSWSIEIKTVSYAINEGLIFE